MVEARAARHCHWEDLDSIRGRFEIVVDRNQADDDGRPVEEHRIQEDADDSSQSPPDSFPKRRAIWRRLFHREDFFLARTGEMR